MTSEIPSEEEDIPAEKVRKGRPTKMQKRGRMGGGGTHEGPRKCSGCDKPGHTYRTCPDRDDRPAKKTEHAGNSEVFFSKDSGARGKELTMSQYDSIHEAKSHGMSEEDIVTNMAEDEVTLGEVQRALGSDTYYFYRKSYRQVTI